nr:MAG TPA: hypothetical protein [Bacteriophage sp.]
MFCTSLKRQTFIYRISIPREFVSSQSGSPTIIWVSHSRGLPRSTSSISGLIVSLALYVYNNHIKNLGYFNAVSKNYHWLFFPNARTLLSSQIV